MKKQTLSFFAAMVLIAGCSTPSKTPSAETTPATEVKVQAAPVKEGPAKPIPKPAVSMDHYVCTNRKEVRELFIEPVTPVGCKLWYTNVKTGQPVAGSTKGLSRCESVHESIRKKLEAGGFTCKPANEGVTK